MSTYTMKIKANGRIIDTFKGVREDRVFARRRDELAKLKASLPMGSTYDIKVTEER